MAKEFSASRAVHGLKWDSKARRLESSCGVTRKHDLLSPPIVSAPENPERWTSEEGPPEDMYLRQSQMAERITCRRCLLLSTPEGRKKIADWCAKGQLRAVEARIANKNTTYGKKHNHPQKRAMHGHGVGPFDNPGYINAVVKSLEKLGYAITPPPPKEEEVFHIDSEKFPVSASLFRELLVLFSNKR